MGVVGVCDLAGVPRVCPHSLRGLHSTLALEAGATSGAVAAALGHGSFAVTARHYADPDTLRNTVTRRVTDVLANAPATDYPAPAAVAAAAPATLAAAVSAAGIVAAMRSLSPEQLAEVFRVFLSGGVPS